MFLINSPMRTGPVPKLFASLSSAQTPDGRTPSIECVRQTIDSRRNHPFGGCWQSSGIGRAKIAQSELPTKANSIQATAMLTAETK
jgi:hypothetical protein